MFHFSNSSVSVFHTFRSYLGILAVRKVHAQQQRLYKQTSTFLSGDSVTKSGAVLGRNITCLKNSPNTQGRGDGSGKKEETVTVLRLGNCSKVMTGHDYSSGDVEKLAPASQLQHGNLKARLKMSYHILFRP